MKKKFEGVRSRGLKIAIFLSVILITICLYSNFFSGFGFGNFIFGNKSLPLPICDGRPQVISRDSPQINPDINQKCLLMVLVSHSAKSRISVTAKNSVDICFWKKNRCAAWMHIKDNKFIEMTEKEIPHDYTAILLSGGPGKAEIFLYR